MFLKKSGCHSKCNIREFSFIKKSIEEVTWRHNWSSSFFLRAEKTLIRREEELLAFDIEDMINGIVYDATVEVIACWKQVAKA